MEDAPIRRPRKTLTIVLSIIGIVALVGVLSCAGLIYWGVGMFADLQGAQAGANTFLDHVTAGRLDEAYDATSPAFRAKVGKEQFRALVNQYPAFTKPTRRSLGGMRVYQNPSGRQAIVQVNLANQTNSLSFALALVKVGKQWKVESINMP